jgi:hypothetical protein|tara:strand:+ start:112 stop:291 length:180 start_codon:yes stop_codon:yes gene_type:complete
MDDDTRGFPFVYMSNDSDEELASYEFNRSLLIEYLEKILLTNKDIDNASFYTYNSWTML